MVKVKEKMLQGSSFVWVGEIMDSGCNTSCRPIVTCPVMPLAATRPCPSGIYEFFQKKI